MELELLIAYILSCIVSYTVITFTHNCGMNMRICYGEYEMEPEQVKYSRLLETFVPIYNICVAVSMLFSLLFLIIRLYFKKK